MAAPVEDVRARGSRTYRSAEDGSRVDQFQVADFGLSWVRFKVPLTVGYALSTWDAVVAREATRMLSSVIRDAGLFDA